jgi:hypothetical protein
LYGFGGGGTSHFWLTQNPTKLFTHAVHKIFGYTECLKNEFMAYEARDKRLDLFNKTNIFVEIFVQHIK